MFTEYLVCAKTSAKPKFISFPAQKLFYYYLHFIGEETEVLGS